MTELLIAIYLNLFAVVPTIDVVYPRPMGSDTLAYFSKVDTNFIFGSVTPPDAKLTINNQPISLYSNGAFLANLPVDWNSKTYNLRAYHEQDSNDTIVYFDQPNQVSIPRTEPNLTFPCTVELYDGIARNDPRGTYYLYPDTGTIVEAVSWNNGYYQIPISAGHSVWVEEQFVSIPENLSKPALSTVWGIKLKPVDGWVELSIPIGQKILYRVWDARDPNRIFIDFFGVISHLDQISYSPGTDLVKEIRWEEPSDNVLRLELTLSDISWGYKTRWEDGKFIFSIKQPPSVKRNIEGLVITIDPGHGGSSFGAIGPTRLTEKDINLRVSLELARLLEKRGAIVTMTRYNDTEVSLTERTKIAEEVESDLLISIHHNALPDGANPFNDNLGTGTYHYHSQSRDLAISVNREIVKELDLPDEGVYYRDFSLTRPTAMPALLIEFGYIMLPEHEMLMNDENYPEQMSIAIYTGIKKYLNHRIKREESSKKWEGNGFHLFD